MCRNIIYKEDKYYSIDDHGLDEPIESLNDLKMKKYLKEIWNKKIIEHKKDIYDILMRWYNYKTSNWKRMCQINDLLKNLKINNQLL